MCSKKSEIHDYASYGGKFFPEKFETRNYGGSENFIGQIAQLCKYVITNLQKKKNIHLSCLWCATCISELFERKK